MIISPHILNPLRTALTALPIACLAACSTLSPVPMPETAPTARLNSEAESRNIDQGPDLEQKIAIASEKVRSMPISPLTLWVEDLANRVDGQIASTPLFGLSSPITTNVTSRVLEGSLHTAAVRMVRSDCRGSGILDGRPQLLLKSSVSEHDQSVRSRTRGMAPSADLAGGTGEVDAGSKKETSRFAIYMSLRTCSGAIIKSAEPMIVEYSEEFTDRGIFVFAKAAGVVLNNSAGSKDGATAALRDATTLLIADFLPNALQAADNFYAQQRRQATHRTLGTLAVAKSLHQRARFQQTKKHSPKEDEVVSYGQKTHKTKKRYFPRSARHSFSCRMKRKLHCSLNFEMPSGGRLSDYSYYLRTSAEEAGGLRVKTKCTERGSRVKCSLNGDMSGFSSFAFKKALFG